MDNAWQRYVEVVSSVTQVTQRRAEQVVRALVRRGEVEASKGEKTVEGLITRVEQNRKAVASIVRSEIEDTVRRMGLARQSDIDRLQAKIARLEHELRGEGKAATGRKTVAEKTAGSKQSSAARKAPVAKKTTAAAKKTTAAARKAADAKKTTAAARRSTTRKAAPPAEAAPDAPPQTAPDAPPPDAADGTERS